jgi:hypothetical protein
MKITWFRQQHENRNDLLRFGLMKLYYNRDIVYHERPFTEISRFGFSNKIQESTHLRHLSFLLVEDKNRKIRCIVDNEDSFVFVSPLITEIDIYFCAGYNSDFFEKKRFVSTYNWQNEKDVQWYRKTIQNKIDTLGNEFNKIKRFIPIAPNLANHLPVSAMKRKFRNLEHKVNRTLKKSDNFKEDYKGFHIRYYHLKALRENHLEFDIVLNDTMWGWPEHRINLHKSLKQLHDKRYIVHSTLRWSDPLEEDGSIFQKHDRKMFPMVTTALHQDYEAMLSKSRLGVFACGFHWGWRNIMMFALMVGIPVLTDRLLTEAYFDINEFNLFQSEKHTWDSIETLLSTITADKWQDIKLHNQSVYDKYMDPEIVAKYFINSALS